jgi:uncharacterized protein (TIGR02996 family)
VTDDRTALLHFIRAHPEDDAPRLVYADYLEENGDPDRACFIRLSCKAARLPPDSAERARIEVETKRLTETNFYAWWGAYHYFSNGAHFDRGLPVVCIHKSKLPDLMPEIAERHPEIIGIKIPAMRGDAGPIDVLRVFSSPHLSNFSVLHFHGLDTSDTNLIALAANPALARATRLSLSFCKIGDTGALALARSQHLSALVELQLYSAALGPAAAAALSAGLYAPSLRLLDLRANFFRDEGIEAIATMATPLSQLEHLDLSSTAITKNGVRQIALSHRFPPTTIVKMCDFRVPDYCGTIADTMVEFGLSRSPNSRKSPTR